MNLRFLLRLVTHSAVYLLAAACFGIVLWIIDEFLGWDILPDAWSLLVRALVVAGGIIALVLVVMNIILSLALLAEANASRAELPDFQISRRWRRRFRRSLLSGALAVALLVTGLQVTDRVRARIALQAEKAEFEQIQAELDEALPEVLALFTEPLQTAISTNTHSDQTQLFQLRRLFDSVSRSFPHSPSVALLVPAESPYDYARIGANSITANGSQLFLAPEYYSSFPSAVETEAVTALFNGTLPDVDGTLEGEILRNTVPSTWGVLEQDDKVIALVYLAADYYVPGAETFTHAGPDALVSQ